MTEHEQLDYIRNYTFADDYQLLHLQTYVNRNILLHAKIKHGTTTHHIVLKNYPDGLYWRLTPYNGSYFLTRADYEGSFNLVLHAICEHAQMQNKLSAVHAHAKKSAIR